MPADRVLRKIWSFDTERRIESIDVSPEGAYIAIGSQDGFLSIFYDNGLPVWSLDISEPITDLEVDRDCETILCCTDNGNLHCYDRRGKLLWKQSSGEFTRAGVRFTSYGEKTLILEYAKMKPLDVDECQL